MSTASTASTVGTVMAVAALAAVFIASPAEGQGNPGGVQRLDRQLRQLRQIEEERLRIARDQPISERLLLDYGGSIRFGLVGVDNEFGTTRVLRQTDGILFVRAELDGAHRFVGRLRFRYNDFNSGDSFDDDGDELEQPIGDRYWYQYDLRGAKLAESGTRIDYNVNLRTGRQYVEWGSGLSLSNALYAGIVEVENEDFAVEALVGMTTPSSTIDFDGTRPGYDSDTDRNYFGARLEYRGFRDHRPYFSFLAQRDNNDRNFTVFTIEPASPLDPPTLVPTSFGYDSEYYSIGSEGTLGPQVVYRAELVYETGDGLSNSFDPVAEVALPQTTESVEAWAGVVGVTFLPRDDDNSRAELEFIFGSGDSDRLDPGDTLGGNLSGTNDESFNSLGYVNTGLALAPQVSNLLSLRAGWSISPPVTAVQNDWLRFGVDAFLFAKADKDAPMNFRTTNETFLGGEIDISLDWRISSDVSASLRYGVFIPGDAMPDGEDDPRHFIYGGVTYAF